MIRKGFTLIELLVVIAILAVLATLLLANLNSARERARDAQRKSDLRSIKTALALYYADNGTYPASDGSYHIMGCGNSGVDQCTWGGQFYSKSTLYMSIIPLDPQYNNTPAIYYMYWRLDPDSYIMRACIENKSDPSANLYPPVANWNCPSGYVYQVYVQ
jgi:type II secretion system protein G